MNFMTNKIIRREKIKCVGERKKKIIKLKTKNNIYEVNKKLNSCFTQLNISVIS